MYRNPNTTPPSKIDIHIEIKITLYWTYGTKRNMKTPSRSLNLFSLPLVLQHPFLSFSFDPIPLNSTLPLPRLRVRSVSVSGGRNRHLSLTPRHPKRTNNSSFILSHFFLSRFCFHSSSQVVSKIPLHSSLMPLLIPSIPFPFSFHSPVPQTRLST
jgi:hypothetical protein